MSIANLQKLAIRDRAMSGTKRTSRKDAYIDEILYIYIFTEEKIKE